VMFVVNRLALGRDFLRVFRLSPFGIVPPMLHTHLHLHVARTTRTNGRSLETYISSTGQQSRPAFIFYASEAGLTAMPFTVPALGVALV
jgi:hypothetical protein